ncbi:MAG: hypothetical protein R3B70_07395, partial [Polyangiaceae bacterium]
PEAAELHARAARTSSSALTQVYSNMSGAMARMEAFAFEEAAALAARAVEQAAALRHAFMETTSRWVLRSLAYRQGEAHKPDRRLLDSVPHIGNKELEATVCMTEAVIAWRTADREPARDLASRAFALFQSIGMKQGVLINRGLLLLTGEDASDSDVRDLHEIALGDLPPGLGIQGLGLLALAGRLDVGAVTRPSLEKLTERVPREHWGTRMDVLSVDESLAAIERCAPP